MIFVISVISFLTWNIGELRDRLPRRSSRMSGAPKDGEWKAHSGPSSSYSSKDRNTPMRGSPIPCDTERSTSEGRLNTCTVHSPLVEKGFTSPGSALQVQYKDFSKRIHNTKTFMCLRACCRGADPLWQNPCPSLPGQCPSRLGFQT